VLSPGEQEWYRSRGAQLGDFFTLWTLKESYYKFLGTGLPGMPNGTEFRLVGDAWTLQGCDDCHFFTWKSDKLVLALCSQDKLVKWVPMES
jgi:phosphopantetheinyl transferase